MLNVVGNNDTSNFCYGPIANGNANFSDKMTPVIVVNWPMSMSIVVLNVI